MSGAMQAALALSLLLCASPPGALPPGGAASCRLLDDARLDGLRAAGANGSLAAKGWATAPGLLAYDTPYTVEVGIWVDDAFLATSPDAAALALRYLEHGSCTTALGTGPGVASHELSLRLAANRVRYIRLRTPEIADAGGRWVQQLHREWRGAMDRLPASAKVPRINVLFTTRPIVEFQTSETGDLVWGPLGGASNGIGQGQAIVTVSPDWYRNGMSSGGLVREQAEDWWGLIAVHELGHAMGRGGHTAEHFDTMCCSSFDYSDAQHGNIRATDLFLSEASWAMIKANNDGVAAEYDDPYRDSPDPVTRSTWEFAQVRHFLDPSAPELYPGATPPPPR